MRFMLLIMACMLATCQAAASRQLNKYEAVATAEADATSSRLEAIASWTLPPLPEFSHTIDYKSFDIHSILPPLPEADYQAHIQEYMALLDSYQAQVDEYVAEMRARYEEWHSRITASLESAGSSEEESG